MIFIIGVRPKQQDRPVNGQARGQAGGRHENRAMISKPGNAGLAYHCAFCIKITCRQLKLKSESSIQGVVFVCEVIPALSK